MSRFVVQIPVPSMGATVHEMTVIDIFAHPERDVQKGERIAELESDKSVFDLEAPCSGRILAWQARAGDVVETNTPLLQMETEDATVRHLAIRAGAANPPGEAPSAPPKASPVAPIRTPETGPVAGLPAGNRWTPRAIKLLRDAGRSFEEADDLAGTGPGGRVSGDDVAKWLAANPAPSVTPTAAGEVAASPRDETVCVAGIGYAVPGIIRSNREILKAFPKMTEEEIVRITGIKQRHYAAEGESARDLAALASQHALKMAGIEATEIDAIILATILPDQPVPSAASDLARHLGATRALAFDLNAACSGWLYALEVGRALIQVGTSRKCLVVTAELLSRITNPKDHATAFLFGDGAGAAVLTADQGGHRLNRMALSGDATFFEAIQREGGGARMPFPKPGDLNMDHFYLSMDGPVVFKQAVRAFGDIIEATLKRHELAPDDVAWIVPHQANERILRAVSKRVGIPYERFVVTIGKYGNTSAASVSMALGWAAEEGIFSSGDRIIFCSVGAGFTFAGGALDLVIFSRLVSREDCVRVTPVIDVKDYLIDHLDRDWPTLLAPWQWLLPPVYSVWLVNRFADVVLVDEDGKVHFLDVGAGMLRQVAENQAAFCQAISTPDKAHEWLLIAFTQRLRREGLVPGPDECYGFRIFPGLGGDYSLENIELRNLALQYAVTGKIFHQLKDVPEGARIRVKLDKPQDSPE